MYKQWNLKTDLIGPISIISNEKIEEIILSNPQENSMSLAFKRYGPLEMGKNDSVEEFETFLNHYLKSENYDFDLKNLNLDKCKDFQKRVLKEQCKTEFGSTNYYKDIAIAINNPNASRAVGNALRNNPFPIVVPCHRTIKGNNEIGGFSGDVKNFYKKILLHHEGNEIKDNKILKKSI
ncbi:MAG: MGMT family protein [Methanobrevibacter sp.]|uniref:methylated-DNA--[protein]-cysteine S-methyltransferase n=1 Tax=Methanobrevibacter sp. TaxID=66852 RepID=UPI0026E075DD|nr:MGMT family protein [Methanobrevibacter sp.]MDO5849199.1 MGMT family protein [Methanobrevibacter sp.]